MTNFDIHTALARLSQAEVHDPDLSDIRDELVEILVGIVERLPRETEAVAEDDTPEGRLRRSAEKAALLSE